MKLIRGLFVASVVVIYFSEGYFVYRSALCTFIEIGIHRPHFEGYFAGNSAVRTISNKISRLLSFYCHILGIYVYSGHSGASFSELSLLFLHNGDSLRSQPFLGVGTSCL